MLKKIITNLSRYSEKNTILYKITEVRINARIYIEVTLKWQSVK